MKKRLVFAIVLLVLFSTYKSKKSFLTNQLNIKTIKIENNFTLTDKQIKKDLIFLYDQNLIFLDTLNIEKVLKKKSFIESFKIKKIYPNKLKIKKPILILQHKKKKFYISENIDLIDYVYLEEYKNLPVVFGNKEKFEILYRDLEKIGFPFNLIKNYYLFESNRWDLEIYKKKIIKLPSENYINSLRNFMNLRMKNNFDRYEIFDYRINNQLILK